MPTSLLKHLTANAIHVGRRFRHTSLALTDQTVISGSNFLTSILLARIMGVSEFGRFALAWSILLLAQSIQYAAISTPMMAIAPKQDETQLPTYYTSVFVHQLLFVVTAAAATWIGATTIALARPTWQLEGIATPLSAAILFGLTHDFLRRYFYASRRVHLSLMLDATRYLAQIAVLVALLTYGLSVDTNLALWMVVCTAAIASMAAIPFIHRFDWSWPAFKTLSMRVWQFAKWTTPSSLLQWASGHVWLIMSGALLGTSAVGAVRAAYNLVSATHIFFLGLENVVPLNAARYYATGGVRSLNHYVVRALIVGTLIAAALASVFAVTPEMWLDLLYGRDFRNYGMLLREFALLELLVFLGLPLRAWLGAVENPKWIFYATASAGVISVLLAYPMISIFGVHGVPLGAFVAAIVNSAILLIGIKVISRIK